jgi:hypothetical protein
MLTQEIKNLISDLYQSTPDNVGVGFGYKIIGNQQTEQESIVFLVPKKIPLSDLKEEEILPNTTFNLGNRVIVTDVIEVGEIKPFSPTCACVCAASCNPACYTWQTTPPLNRQFIRPIKGGISLTSRVKWPPYSPAGSVGTLGAIVVDTETDALVGLTNNHVVIRDAFYTDQRNPLGVIENEYDISDGGVRDPDFAYQPGEFGPNSSYIIGQVIRYVPIYSDGTPSKVDGALVSVECDPVTDPTESFKQLGLSYVSPMPFATTAEIDNLMSTNPMLKSSGRTTGVKDGPPCPLRTFAVNVSVPVGPYPKQGTSTTVPFTELIQFVRPQTDPNLGAVCQYPIYPGDSGSVLIADFGGTHKIIGLNFAGSECYGFACRIDNVAAELGIKAWDGLPKPVVDNDTIDYITVNGGNDVKTQVCDGKTYWQVGLTNLSKSCSGLTSFELSVTYTNGSTVANYSLLSNGPAPYDYSLTFKNVLTTTSGPDITFMPSLFMQQGLSFCEVSVTSSIDFSLLTKNSDFSMFTLNTFDNPIFDYQINISYVFQEQTPTPTPTSTITPTPTVTPTPTPSPEPVIIYYDVLSCVDFSSKVAKFELLPPIVAPTVGSTYYLTTNNADFDACYNIVSIGTSPEDFTVTSISEEFIDCITCEAPPVILINPIITENDEYIDVGNDEYLEF